MIVGALGLFALTAIEIRFQTFMMSEIQTFLENSFNLSCAILSMVVIICIGCSYYFIVKHSKTLKNSDKSKFEMENFWFWAFLLMIPIMAGTWFVEFCVLISYIRNNDYPWLLADFIRLFTAISIFLIFVKRENAKNLVFQRCRGVQRSISSSL